MTVHDRLLLCLGSFALAACRPAGSGQCEPSECARGGVVGECVAGYCAIPTDQCPEGEWIDGPDQGLCVGGNESPTDSGVSESTESESESSGEESETGTPDDMPADLPPEQQCEPGIEGKNVQAVDVVAVEDGPIDWIVVEDNRPLGSNIFFAVAAGTSLRVYRLDENNASVAEVPIPAGFVTPPLVSAAALLDGNRTLFAFASETGGLSVRASNDAWDEQTIATLDAADPLHVSFAPNAEALLVVTKGDHIEGRELTAPYNLKDHNGGPDQVAFPEPIVFADDWHTVDRSFLTVGGDGQILTLDGGWSTISGENSPTDEVANGVMGPVQVEVADVSEIFAIALYEGGTIGVRSEDDSPWALLDIDGGPFDCLDVIGAVDDTQERVPILGCEDGVVKTFEVEDAMTSVRTGELCGQASVTAVASLSSGTRDYVLLGDEDGNVTVFSVL